MIRLLLADDHRLLRDGLKELFSFTDDIIVTGEAATGEDVLLRLAEDTFDLILLDLSMPGIGGAELICRIRADVNNPPILVLTMHDDPRIARRKLHAGAVGFITKNSPPDMLMDAIRKVATGGRYIQPDIAEALAFLHPDVLAETARERLAPQELRVLRLLAKGMRVVDIAQELGISDRTVSTYKARLTDKLEIESDADLIRYADAMGLV